MLIHACFKCNFEAIEFQVWKQHALEKHPEIFENFVKSTKETSQGAQCLENSQDQEHHLAIKDNPNNDFTIFSQYMSNAQEIQKNLKGFRENPGENQGHPSKLINKNIGNKISIKLYQCPMCSYKSERSFKTERHVEVTHMGKGMCQKNLKTGSDMHVGKSPCLCTACGKFFSFQSDLLKHVRKHNITTEEGLWTMSCSIITKLPFQCYNLIAENELKCVNCNLSCSNLSTLKSHISSVHVKKKIYFCNTCAEGFIDLKSIEVHLQEAHTDFRIFNSSFLQKLGSDSEEDQTASSHQRQMPPKFPSIVDDIESDRISTLINATTLTDLEVNQNVLKESSSHDTNVGSSENVMETFQDKMDCHNENESSSQSWDSSDQLNIISPNQFTNENIAQVNSMSQEELNNEDISPDQLTNISPDQLTNSNISQDQLTTSNISQDQLNIDNISTYQLNIDTILQDELTNVSPDLLDHYNIFRNSKEINLLCNYCNSSFTDEETMLDHFSKFTVYTKEGETQLVCENVNKEVQVTADEHSSTTLLEHDFPGGLTLVLGSETKPSTQDQGSANELGYSGKEVGSEENENKELPLSNPALAFKCQMCEYQASTRNDVTKHMAAAHMKENWYSCNNCQKSYKEKRTLFGHVTRLTKYTKDGVPYMNCTKRVKPAEKSLNKTETTNEQNEAQKHSITMPESNNNERTKKEINKMIKKSRPKIMYQCQVCEYKSTGLACVRRHQMSIHLQVMFYQCQGCRVGMRSLRAFYRHILKFTDSGTSEPYCPVNQTESTKKYQYLKCSVCPFSCLSQNHLRRHIGNRHTKTYKDFARKKVDAPELKCDLCPYKAKKKFSIKNHLQRIHLMQTIDKNVAKISDSPDLKCDLCPYTSKKKSNLSRHTQTVHERQTNFLCEHCGIVYLSKRSLSQHIVKYKDKATGNLSCGKENTVTHPSFQHDLN